MAKKESSTATDQQTHSKKRLDISLWIKDIFHGVWTFVGLIIIGVVLAAVFTGNSVMEIIGDTSQTGQAPAGQTAPPPQSGPTEEQLACVGAEVGEERLEELIQGAPANSEEESQIIDRCLGRQ